jgi:hypothetical protein
MEIKQGMLLCIGCSSWNLPKSILIQTNGYSAGKRLDDIAKEAFYNYKAAQLEDIYLVDYTYLGNVEIITTIENTIQETDERR